MFRRKTVVVAGVALIVLASLGGALISYAGGVPEEATYVGTSKCRLCHLKQYKSWQKTKHAGTFDVLLEAERKDAECIRCHVTGYGKPSGYIDEATTAGLKNVGCESCHGAGSEHVKAAKKKPASGEWDAKIDKVPRNKCITCHNPHINRAEKAKELRAARGAAQ